MSTESSKRKKLKRVTDCLTAPVRQHAPFVITWCLLMGSETIRAWNTAICFPWGIRTALSFFCRLCIVFLQAWTLAFIMTKVRWRWLKVLSYLLLFIPFTITLYLIIDQRSLISPTALNLLFETDRREVIDFLNLYVFSHTGIIILLTVTAISGLVMVLEHYRAKINACL